MRKILMKNILTKKQIIILITLFFIQLLLSIFIYNFLIESSNIVKITKILSLEILKFSMIFFQIASIILLMLFFYAFNNDIGKIKKMNSIKIIFYTFMFLTIGIMIIMGYLTHGEYIRSMLHNNKNDVFMDYFNSIQYGLKPYSRDVIYPPLINVFYGFIGRFAVKDEIPLLLRVNQLSAIVFLFYSLFTYWLLYYSLNEFSKKYLIKSKEINLFLCMMLFSLPFLFMMERANSIILALSFSMLFLAYYNINNIKAFICLGIAVSIKITPCVFALILLRDRKWKEALICAIIISAIFNLPFILTDGNIFILIDNIMNATNIFQGAIVCADGSLRNIGYGVYVNIGNTIKTVAEILHTNLNYIITPINILLFCWATGMILMNKNISEWKIYTLLCGIITLTPGFSAVYNLIYYIIPLICFLSNNPKSKLINYVYISLFLLIFIPIVNIDIPIFENVSHEDIYPIRISTLVESISILLLTILILIENTVPKKLLLGEK